MRISDWSSDVCSSDLRLGGRWLQLDERPLDAHPFTLGAEGGKLLAHQYRQLGTLPPAVGEQCMGPRERLDAPADGGDEFVGARRLRQLDHRVDDGEQVPGAVIDLAREQLLALLVALALGDVADDADEPHGSTGGIADDASPYVDPAKLDRKSTRLNSSH